MLCFYHFTRIWNFNAFSTRICISFTLKKFFLSVIIIDTNFTASPIWSEGVRCFHTHYLGRVYKYLFAWQELNAKINKIVICNKNIGKSNSFSYQTTNKIFLLQNIILTSFWCRNCYFPPTFLYALLFLCVTPKTGMLIIFCHTLSIICLYGHILFHLLINFSALLFASFFARVQKSSSLISWMIKVTFWAHFFLVFIFTLIKLCYKKYSSQLARLGSHFMPTCTSICCIITFGSYHNFCTHMK